MATPDVTPPDEIVSQRVDYIKAQLIEADEQIKKINKSKTDLINLWTTRKADLIKLQADFKKNSETKTKETKLILEEIEARCRNLDFVTGIQNDLKNNEIIAGISNQNQGRKNYDAALAYFQNLQVLVDLSKQKKYENLLDLSENRKLQIQRETVIEQANISRRLFELLIGDSTFSDYFDISSLKDGRVDVQRIAHWFRNTLWKYHPQLVSQLAFKGNLRSDVARLAKDLHPALSQKTPHLMFNENVAKDPILLQLLTALSALTQQIYSTKGMFVPTAIFSVDLLTEKSWAMGRIGSTVYAQVHLGINGQHHRLMNPSSMGRLYLQSCKEKTPVNSTVLPHTGSTPPPLFRRNSLTHKVLPNLTNRDFPKFHRFSFDRTYVSHAEFDIYSKTFPENPPHTVLIQVTPPTQWTFPRDAVLCNLLNAISCLSAANYAKENYARNFVILPVGKRITASRVSDLNVKVILNTGSDIILEFQAGKDAKSVQSVHFVNHGSASAFWFYPQLTTFASDLFRDIAGLPK